MLIGAGGTALTSLGFAPRRSFASALPMDPTLLNLVDASRAIQLRILSPVELTEACLRRIARLDTQLNSFITITAERALSDARRAQDELAKGRVRGPLHGIPIALEDNVDTAGVRLQNAGAVLLGKLNLHGLASGTRSSIGGYGAVRNPWDSDSASGTSDGSATAVAASLCFGSLGTDTGGSLRAASCGVVGLKPTFPTVGRQSVGPVSSSLRQVGPLCRTVEDTAVLFGEMTEHPIATVYRRHQAPWLAQHLTVGVVRNLPAICYGAMQSEVEAIFEKAVETLRPLVAEVRDIELAYSTLGSVIDAAPEPDLFSQVDVVILPVAGSCTFNWGPRPAMSIPCGFSKSRVPVGMLMGAQTLREPELFSLAQAYEQNTQWHGARPPLMT